MPKASEELDSVTEFALQGPSQHRSEEDKVWYLYEALFGASWANISIFNALSSKIMSYFHHLYTFLYYIRLIKQG